MNRLERINGRLENFSEPNYSEIDFLFREARFEKWRTLGKDALRLGFLWGCIWLIVWGVAKNL